MTICAVNGLDVFKRSKFKNNDLQKCPCGEKNVFKAAPIKPFVQIADTFEHQCCGKKGLY